MRDFYDRSDHGAKAEINEASMNFGADKHQCNTCHTILIGLKDLITHEITVHSETRGKLHCADCNQDYSTKFELIRHKRLFCEVINPSVREKRQEVEAERIKEKKERLMKMKKSRKRDKKRQEVEAERIKEKKERLM